MWIKIKFVRSGSSAILLFLAPRGLSHLDPNARVLGFARKSKCQSNFLALDKLVKA